MSHPRHIAVQLRAWTLGQGGAVRLASGLALAETLAVIGFAWGLSHLVTERGSPWPMAVLVVAMLARAGLSWLARQAGQKAALAIVRGVRRGYVAAALDGRVTAGAVTSLFEDSEALEGYYARYAQADLTARVVPLVVLGVVATQSWVAALILAGTLLPFITLMALLGMASAAEQGRQLDALGRLSHLLLDRVRALPLILAFSDGARQTATVGQAANDVAARTLRVLKIAFVTSAVLEFFAALSVALIAVYCGFYLLGALPFKSPEPLTLSTAFFVLALSPELYAPMRRLAAAYHDRQAARAAAERLMRIELRPAPVPAAALTAPPEVVYDAVTVSFPDDPDYRIGPVTFTCTPGSVTCLAGPTGSGKTTLLRLLIAPRGERLTVDGQAIGPGHDIAAQVAYVPQVAPILAGTLRDNLRLANHDADDAAILAAAQRFGLGDVIAARSLDGVLDERGSGLSGGERRKLALARAWLKPSRLVVMDEPSADLDAVAEAELAALLPGLFAGRTVLYASHAPRLIALADQVVRL